MRCEKCNLFVSFQKSMPVPGGEPQERQHKPGGCKRAVKKQAEKVEKAKAASPAPILTVKASGLEVPDWKVRQTTINSFSMALRNAGVVEVEETQ